MEPLPSDVARLVLGYLTDTCPDLATQFLANSPDLAELRRMKRRAHRPFGPSLFDLLTEHATASSLVEDVDSAMKWRGGATGSEGFLCKLRRLLSVIAGAKKGTAVAASGSADTVYRQPGDAGGVWQGMEAATAGHWTDGHESPDDSHLDETPAIGGDFADTPAGEAAVGDSPGKWEAAEDSSHRRESSRDCLVLEDDCDSPADRVGDGEARPDPSTAAQTELTSSATSPRKDDAGVPGRSFEGSGGRDLCGSGRNGTPGDSGGDRSAAPKGDGVNRRKSRPPRRSGPEQMAALARSRTSSLPVGWIFGQVRHCPSSGRSATAPVDRQSTQRLQQQQPERSEPERRTPVPRDITTVTGRSDPTPPSPAAKKDLQQSPPPQPSAPPASWATSPSAVPASSAARPTMTAAPVGRPSVSPAAQSPLIARPSAHPAGPAAPSTAGGRQSARKGSAPRRRALSECGTTVVRPGALRSRPLPSRRPNESRGTAESPLKEGGEPVSPVKQGRVGSDKTGVSEPHTDGKQPSTGESVMESAAKKAKISESPTKEDEVSKLPVRKGDTATPVAGLSPPFDSRCEAVRRSRLPSPRPGGATVRWPSPVSDGYQSPPPDVNTSSGSSPATSDASSAQSSPPDADSSDAFSPALRHVGDGMRPPPAGGADGGVPPSPSQLSGRSSQLSGRSELSDRISRLSERSTPFSQRSLHICLTPTSGKTPSVNGSLLADETPTSARRSARCGARRGGRSGSGWVSAPRRRLLTDLRRRSESPQLPPDISRPSAHSTPTATATATATAARRGPVAEVSDAERRVREGHSAAAAGGRRRTVRRAGPLPVTDPADRSGERPERSGRAKRPLPPSSDRSASPPVKVPSDTNNKSLLKSIDIMSFLSRIHSVGSS